MMWTNSVISLTNCVIMLTKSDIILLTNSIIDMTNSIIIPPTNTIVLLLTDINTGGGSAAHGGAAHRVGRLDLIVM